MDELDWLLKKIQDAKSPSIRPVQAVTDCSAPSNSPANWLVSLATLPGGDAQLAKRVANAKMEAARASGIAAGVSIYRTTIKNRFVVSLGRPLVKDAALALAAEARRVNLASDAFAEQISGWQAVGTAPFAIETASLR